MEAEIRKELSVIKDEGVAKFYSDFFREKMRGEFSKIISAPKIVVPKNTTNSASEKWILAFAIAYPSKFFTLLEKGVKIEFKDSVMKKIFAEVESALTLTPHTRDTLLKLLGDKGFIVQNLLRFEMESLIAKPSTAEIIIDEKILLMDKEALEAEHKNLQLAILNAEAGDVEHLQLKAAALMEERGRLEEKLDDIRARI